MMRNPLLWLAIMISFVNSLSAQVNDYKDLLYSGKLPAGLRLKENSPQQYKMITDYYNHDILGDLLSKMRVTGIYTRGLDSGFVKWNNVRIAQAASKDQPFPEGTKQEYMENFTYVPSAGMMGSSPYKNFPPNSEFEKNLVWDVMGFEVFAYPYFDSLRINVPFRAKQVNGKVELEGLGEFENKNITLTWTGISMMHNETCAVIEYLALGNPLDFKTDLFNMKGRSNYWGTIWLSLNDKQIEQAVLYEDVNMEMQLKGQEKSQLSNTTREIIFNKIMEENRQ
jgi:hypothetical protein